jgi:16S rRNA (cytidine1402-2'-O)-methyltransferase
MSSVGILYVIALPIGNPRDITLRALDVLSSVDIVAAEDTRTFNELCKELKIEPKRVVAHHEHNEAESTQGLIALLLKGDNVAIVTDAGTPGISDPGFRLVRQSFVAEIKVVPLPGASSLTTALSISPIGGRSSYFGGFLSSTSAQRKKELEELKEKADRLVLFESPHRLLEHLSDALEVFGNTEVCACRELTKTYEEIQWGTLTEVIKHFEFHPPKGEFVLIYAKPLDSGQDQIIIEQNIRDLLQQGRSPSDIVKDLQDQTSLKKKQLYNLVLKIKAR